MCVVSATHIVSSVPTGNPPNLPGCHSNKTILHCTPFIVCCLAHLSAVYETSQEFSNIKHSGLDDI